MKTLWHVYADASLVLKISVALVLGVVVGLVFGQTAADVLAPLGELLLRLLKFLIIPLVLCTLIVGINQGNLGSMGRIGRKILTYYAATSALAIVVGLVIASLLSPGSGMTLDNAQGMDVPDNPGVVHVLLSVVPDNIFKAFAELNLLGIIFTAIAFGIAILMLRNSREQRDVGEHLYKVVAGINAATMTIMRGILQFLPIGIFAIVAKTVGAQGTDTIISLGRMVAVLYIALFVHAGLYGVAMWLFKVPLGDFVRHARAPIATAFATQSSSGTLPITLNAASQMGLARPVYGVSLPLGATINMDGAAIRIAISAVFAANVIGTPLDMMQMIQIVLIGTLTSIGTAGVPGAGIIMIATVFTQVGLPIETVALLTSIDALVGMGCTALNVAGDLVGASIIDRSERSQDEATIADGHADSG